MKASKYTILLISSLFLFCNQNPFDNSITVIEENDTTNLYNTKLSHSNCKDTVIWYFSNTDTQFVYDTIIHLSASYDTAIIHDTIVHTRLIYDTSVMQDTILTISIIYDTSVNIVDTVVLFEPMVQVPPEAPVQDSNTGMLRIPAGKFIDNYSDTAFVSSLWMDVTEVTLGRYLKFEPNHQNTYQDNLNYPVENVTWYDAVRYANWRSDQNGYAKCYRYDYIDRLSAVNLKCDFKKNGFRLPTEDEWEFAAKGGNNYKYGTHDGMLNCDQANYYPKFAILEPPCHDSTLTVGSYSPNPFGLYDMSGNVWEWCWDWYRWSGRINNRINYSGPSNGSYKIRRGGAFNTSSISCRTDNRDSYPPNQTNARRGFRLVRRAN